MSSNRSIIVNHCVVDVITKEDIESTFFESSSFIFQSSECYIRICYGWETNVKNERKIRIYIKSKPTLAPPFYASASLLKGNRCICYPFKQIKDPNKCVWSLTHSEISEQLASTDKWDFKYRFVFQQEADSNYGEKNSGMDTGVQTSYYLNESRSIEKLSDDLARLLDVQAKQSSDIKLISGDYTIEAHKAVLMARSEFFEKQLQSTSEDRIKLQYIDPFAFQEIIRYMYTGKSPDLSLDVAKKIYKAGEISNTGFLKERCEEFLFENLTLENACECLALADDDEFRERILRFIMEKDIPFLDEYWKPFCDQHPGLANSVLNKLVRTLASELRKCRE